MESSLFSLIERGGWVMWPLLATSLCGMAFILNSLFRFVLFRAMESAFQKKRHAVLDMIREGKQDEALVWLADARAPSARMYHAALSHSAAWQEALESAATREVNQLRSGFSLIDILITAAPMLGILGTVTGIINTFSHLSTAGFEHPAAASAGISEALITTAAGLIVALTLLFPYTFLMSQLRRCTRLLEECGTEWEIAQKESKRG